MTRDSGNRECHAKVICTEFFSSSDPTLHLLKVLHQGMDGVLFDESPVFGLVCRDFINVQDGQPHSSEDVGRTSTV